MSTCKQSILLIYREGLSDQENMHVPSSSESEDNEEGNSDVRCILSATSLMTYVIYLHTGR